jgi:hypothetical protein
MAQYEAPISIWARQDAKPRNVGSGGVSDSHICGFSA